MHSTSIYIFKLRGSSLETGRGVQDPIKISGTATYRLSILAKGCPALLYVVYCQLAIVKVTMPSSYGWTSGPNSGGFNGTVTLDGEEAS